MKKRGQGILAKLLVFAMLLQTAMPLNVQAASEDGAGTVAVNAESEAEKGQTEQDGATERDGAAEEELQEEAQGEEENEGEDLPGEEGSEEESQDEEESTGDEESQDGEEESGSEEEKEDEEEPSRKPTGTAGSYDISGDEFVIEHVATGKLVKTYATEGMALTVDGESGEEGTVFAQAVFGKCDNNVLGDPALPVATFVSKDYQMGIASASWNNSINGAEATVVKVNGNLGGNGWESVQIMQNGDGTLSFKDSHFDEYISVETVDGSPVLKCRSGKTKEDLTDNEKFIIHMEKAPAGIDSLTINKSTRTRTTMDLSWEKPAGIYTNTELWQKNPDAADFVKIADLAGEVSYQVTDLQPGLTYTFKLRFINGNGDPTDTTYYSESNEATAATRIGEKPSTPENLSIEDVDGQKLVITWDPAQNATHYRVLRAESMLAEYQEIEEVDENRLEYPYTGDKYANYFRVVALNDDDDESGDGEGIEASDESAYISLETQMFGDHTLVFAPTDDIKKIDETLAEIYKNAHDKNADAQFKGEHWQIYFKPGDYTETSCIGLGFYTAISGLGQTPYEVKLNNVEIPDYLGENNATCNFWRSMENVSIINTGNAQGKAANWRPDWLNWAVAQAAPLRRVYSQRPIAYDWNYGWASGGYVADCYLAGMDGEGNGAGTWSGQQFYTRNTKVDGKVFGTTLNNFFQGVVAPNLPDALEVTAGKAVELKSGEGYSNWKMLDEQGKQKVFTNIENTKKIAEKPFLYMEGGEYQIFVPAVRENTKGTSWSENNMGEGKSVSLDTFYFAKPTDSAAVINEQLAAGKNIYFTPGIYHAEETIRVTKADTILLGTGLATIIPDNGDAAMRIADVDGVRVAGLVFDAGKHSEYLLVVGEQGADAGHAADPTILQDLYFRVGGTTDELTKADNALEINSNDVIGDHFWIWRADHGAGVAWYGNESKHGLTVNGDGVTCYALFNEHFQDYCTLWNGENGATYFYQNETAYDPISQEAWMSGDGKINGYASYKVADGVKDHYAVGLGVYNVFIYTGPTYDSTVVQIQLDNAIEVPDTPGVLIENACLQTFADDTKALQKINSVVNGMGDPVSSGTDPVTGETGTKWDRSFLRYYCNGEAEGSFRKLRDAKKELEDTYRDIKDQLNNVTDEKKKEQLEKKLKEIEEALGEYEESVGWPISEDTSRKIDDYKELTKELEDIFENNDPAEEDKTGLWAEKIDDIVYTGSAVKPVVTVYDGTVLLRPNKDYKVSYKNNVKVGKGIVTITGKGNYKGSVTKEFNIVAKDLTDADIEVSNLYAAASRNKKPVKVAPVVTRNGKKLALKKDYVVECPDQTEGAYVKPGTYKVVIKAAEKGGYTGSREITITLAETEQILISKASVAKIANQIYDGTAQRPELTVKYGKTVLKAGEDYTVRYSNNTEIGTATAIVVGTGVKCIGMKKVTFKITGAALKANLVTGIPASAEYTGSEIRPAVQVKDLEEGKHYTVEYVNNTEVGKATVIVKGIGGYTGTVKKVFKITPFDIAGNKEARFKLVSENITAPYAKGGSKPSVEVTFNGTVMTEKVDYTLSYKNNKKAGDAAKKPELTITGKGRFKGKVEHIAFTIDRQDLGQTKASAADIPVKNAKKYDKVMPVIVDLDGQKLKKGTDFVVTGYTYADGSAITSTPEAGAVIRVTAEGRGNYDKTVSAQFRVIANDKNIAGAKVTVNPQTYTGKELRPAGAEVRVQVKVKEGKKNVWKDLKEGTDYEIVADGYMKNIDKGTARLTVRGTGEYGGTKTVTFKIVAQTMSWAEWYRSTAAWFKSLFQ